MNLKIDAKSVIIGLLLGVLVVTTMGQSMGAHARSVLITHDERGGAYMGFLREDNKPFFIFMDRTTWTIVEEQK